MPARPGRQRSVLPPPETLAVDHPGARLALEDDLLRLRRDGVEREALPSRGLAMPKALRGASWRFRARGLLGAGEEQLLARRFAVGLEERRCATISRPAAPVRARLPACSAATSSRQIRRRAADARHRRASPRRWRCPPTTPML